MSDMALRECERSLALEPDNLDLRRRHLSLLVRSGDADRALAALDLAWRLGADDLWGELEGKLAERWIQLPWLTLRYVPAGPYVMGADDFDDDAAPPHLVQLSAFYVTERPISYGALQGWDGLPHWMHGRDMRRESEGRWASIAHQSAHSVARGAAEHLTAEMPPILSGRYALATEAQWERVFRASLLRPDGRSPYGVERGPDPEWTADRYDPAYYDRSPRHDPPGPKSGQTIVVRGIDEVLQPHYALYREAAGEHGEFTVGTGRRKRRVLTRQGGVVTRLVFLPA